MQVLRPIEARFGRWTPIVVSAGVVVVSVAAILVLVYAPSPSLTASPARGPPFVFANSTELRASSAAPGPGGCVAPAGGGVEYCYRLGIQFGRSVFAPLNLSAATEWEFANTSVVSFAVEQVGASADLPFVNVTILSPAGHLLAGFVPGAGWLAYPPTGLPLVIWPNDTAILNLGPASGAGDTLVAGEGAWGSTSAALT